MIEIFGIVLIAILVIIVIGRRQDAQWRRDMMRVPKDVDTESSRRLNAVDKQTQTLATVSGIREHLHVSQPTSEKPRRFFSDQRGHFSLMVWYENVDFQRIIGFQLGFKENPLNTDDEYFLTRRPSNPTGGAIEVSRTGDPDSRSAPASKSLVDAVGPFPPTFGQMYREVATTLPHEIKEYVEGEIGAWL